MAEEILDRATDDWIQLSEVAWVAMSTGGAQTETEVLDMSLAAMRSLLDRGEMYVGDLRVAEGQPAVGPLKLPAIVFRPWDLTVDASMERVRREWVALGRRPNLGDICWLEKRDKSAVAPPAPSQLEPS